MGVPVKSCLFIFITNFLIAVYFLSTCRKTTNYYGNIAPTVLQIRDKLEIDDKFPIVFYHFAYIDYRYSPPRLRLFSMNPCVTEGEYITVELNGIQGRKVKVRGEPTEGECPWHWATQCLYNSYIWEVQLTAEETKIDGVVVYLKNHRISLQIKQVYKKRPIGFTVCVQPVYWYSELHNIALFIEAWRSQGASRFIVYFHSSTENVRRLLEHYQNMGLVDLKPWPLFGNVSSTAASHFPFPSFDSSTYRFGHTLAQNLCILEMRSELGAIADFDEVMVVKRGSVKEYVSDMLIPGVVGAIRFSHLLVKFNPKISTLDYTGTLFPVFLNRNGPPKIVFNSSTVDVIVTHSVRKFIGNESTVTADGALLHYRYNSYTEEVDEVEKSFQLFPETSEFYLRRIQKTIRTVFGTNVPSYNSTFRTVLNTCISKIVGEGKCRSTVAYCKQWMEPLTEWIQQSGENVFLG